MPCSVLTMLMTPAFGVCFGVVGRGGRNGGPGRPGGDFGRLGGAFGIPAIEFNQMNKMPLKFQNIKTASKMILPKLL